MHHQSAFAVEPAWPLAPRAVKVFRVRLTRKAYWAKVGVGELQFRSFCSSIFLYILYSGVNP